VNKPAKLCWHGGRNTEQLNNMKTYRMVPEHCLGEWALNKANNMKTTAELIHTTDTKYKAGHVLCKKCGWKKELGDGFNQYEIDCCPACTPELETRTQRKVMTGNPRSHDLTVELGSFVYFVIKNGIHVQFSKQVHSTHRGLSERQADRL
jgi:hypothetical protein